MNGSSNNNIGVILGAVAALLFGGALVMQIDEQSRPATPPAPPPAPAPAPAPQPKPDKPKPRRPHCPGPNCPNRLNAGCDCANGECGCPGCPNNCCCRHAAHALISAMGGPVGPDGVTQVQVDFPVEQRIRNIGSHVDGAGMCVMSSIEMAARWAGLEQMRGLRDWCAKEPGGAYPSKVDRQIKAFCAAKGIEVPAYVQYEGQDASIIRAALSRGRMVALTYGPAHMVDLVHCDDKYWVFLDNNRIGEDELYWESPKQGQSHWSRGGGGWVFAWLAAPPPPVPF